MMAEASIRDVLADLKSRTDALAVVLVARNGQTLWANVPEGLHVETFGVMCATIFGAASTVQTELGRAAPDRVVAEGNDATTLIVGCGPHALLAAMVERRADLSPTVVEITKIAGRLISR